ncbi:MAG: hydrogenase expression/formation protein [Rubrivivax sp.]|nr:hydrogenase expression/formation protein [Rubrivivax sp.]
MQRTTTTPFPIPVVSALGPGSQPEEEEGLDILPMPQGMSTYRAPQLPEPEALAAHPGSVRALQQVLDALHALVAGGTAAVPTRVVELDTLDTEDRRLLNQVLGEGEVAAQVLGTPGVAQVAPAAPQAAPNPAAPKTDARVRVQESVFAGVWRVLHLGPAGEVVRDRLEVGALPQPLLDAAVDDGVRPARARTADEPPPADVMNAPSLLAELDEQRRQWKPGDAPHVVNLTLLPLTDGDSQHLTREVGEGRVVILSRGYGNCRITSTRLPRTWRVTYFNSTDRIILDTLEISRVPEVACASLEDLEDSAERVAEVLHWVQAG